MRRRKRKMLIGQSERRRKRRRWSGEGWRKRRSRGTGRRRLAS
jgi:hypothetical protein